MTAADDKTARAERAKARRLLVALDASRESLAALEAAADLAARMRFELQGLFIEDQDLLDLARDPLVRTFDANTGRAQDFSAQAFERTLRRQVAEARRAFETIAEQRRLRGTFEVRRGRAVAEIVGSSAAGDLIVVTRTAMSAEIYPVRGGARAGAVARALVAQSQRPVLILSPGARTQGRIFAYYDGSPAAKLALETACQVCDRRGGPGMAVLIAGEGEASDALQQEAGEALAALGHEAAFERIAEASLDGLCTHASREESGVLVLGAEQPLLAQEGAETLLDRVKCSVLLVR